MKRRFTIRFAPEATSKPVTYQLIKDFNFKVNILKASITEGQEGRLLLEAEASPEDLEDGMEFLEREKGITITPVDQQLIRKKEECIHCGACTAVCFPGALSIDKESWEVSLNYEECVVCGLCVDACPMKIISLKFK